MTTITIDRAVVEQALEALQGIYIAPEHDHYINAWWPACRDAIPALRAALAQQAEPVEPVPAAVVATQSDVWRGYNGQWAPPGEPIKMVQMLRDLPTGTPLYTAPPQRKPLTEEVLDQRYYVSTGQMLREQDKRLAFLFARAIERAHGIGGNDD